MFIIKLDIEMINYTLLKDIKQRNALLDSKNTLDTITTIRKSKNILHLFECHICIS